LEKADKEKLTEEEIEKIIDEAAELLKDIPMKNLIEDIRKDRDTR